MVEILWNLEKRGEIEGNFALLWVSSAWEVTLRSRRGPN